MAKERKKRESVFNVPLHTATPKLKDKAKKVSEKVAGKPKAGKKAFVGLKPVAVIKAGAAKHKTHALAGKPKSSAHKEAIRKALLAFHAAKRGGKKAKKAGKKVSHIRGPKPKTKAGRAARGAKIHVKKVNEGLKKHTTKWVTNIKARKRTLHSVTGKPLGRKHKKAA